ncbi:hypothetical protein M413DRAFT_446165 [Hebeloma cylindrosporum]|uniref:Uncharacterized protein n=1 Tax=Hebeloma cylindrosporum TaxID=76867 RepID=A0A0C2XSV9_HEBCY|nr:hypothetical protein M413DRAFT_446165 [Hebeloma cylindrosporum h7]
MPIDILILGAGWSSTFLIKLCDERGISHSATSRSGRESTVKFEFDPESDDLEPYRILPSARTVLITFPIDKPGASKRLVRLYTNSRRSGDLSGELKPRFIQLGTTGAWDGKRIKLDGPPNASEPKWYDRHSPIVAAPRTAAEDELLSLYPGIQTTVLNLSGLWGGSRSARNWVGKVAPSKDALKNKGSLHVIHGFDLARAILAVHDDFEQAQGQRWLITDGRVYDWWDLASAWGTAPLETASSPSDPITSDDRGPQAQWVRELMEETGIRSLPRNVELLGRALDSREFWTTFGLSPICARLEEERWRS